MKRLWLPVAVGLLTAAGCSSDSAAPTPTQNDTDVVLSPSVIAQMDALIAEKAARTPAQRKISSSLLYARNNTFAAALSETKDASKRITSLNQTDASGRVLVDIRADMAALGGKIDALGGKVTNSGKDHAR